MAYINDMQTKDMTDAALRAAATNYRRSMLEGGEGYNPYAAELARREETAEAARPRTLSDREYAILHALEIRDTSLARECGTYDQAEIDTLRAELASVREQRAAELLAAWPLALTQARRSAWNAWVLAQGKAMSYTLAERQEREQGWTMASLRAAIVAHKL